MKTEELLKTNDFYDKHKNDWEFYQAAYQGTKALIEWGVLRQFEDDIDNFNARKAAAFGFNYTKRITNIVTDFLREIPFVEEFGILKEDGLWELFANDCDLYGTNWNNFWGRKRRWVSVYGHCGILVDKAVKNDSEIETVKDEIERGIYPYLAYYSPLHILDWRFDRNEVTNRPTLVYLKLFENGDIVRIWTQENWEVWKLPEKGSEDVPELIKTGANPFMREGAADGGKIPFVWFGNGQDAGEAWTSISDVADIAMIDASMVRDASNADEIITNAAFPMLALPKEEITEGGENTPVEVGPLRILEFPPGSPGDKPFWLDSKTRDSIDAILKMWEKKSEEMYGIANLSAIKEMTRSKTGRSGESLKESFRFLNAILAEKVDSEIEARLLCIKYWLMWQKMENEFKNISVSHEKKFNAEKLMLNIEDAIKAKDVVTSELFRVEVEKLVAKRILSGLTNDQMIEMEKEIQENVPKIKENVLKIKKDMPGDED